MTPPRRALVSGPEAEAEQQLWCPAGPLASMPEPVPSRADPVLRLQDAAGNAAVARLLADENVAAMDTGEKLMRAWDHATERLGPDVRAQLEGLVSPTSLAMLAGFAVAYVAAQLTPAGWVADGIALATLTISAIFVGSVVFDVTGNLIKFLGAVNAHSDAELRAAGAALSQAIAEGGVALVVALLTHAIGKGGGGRPYEGPPPSGYVEALTPEGVLVRMPVEAVAEVAVAPPSVLQQAAAYAVATTPPGSGGFSGPGGSGGEGSGGSGAGPGGPAGGVCESRQPTRGPEVFEEISRELELDPATVGTAPIDAAHAGVARAVADARAGGLIGQRGTPGGVDLATQSHSAAAEVRGEYGVSGADVQSAHVGPTSALRDVAGYSRSQAETVLLDRGTHAAFDQHWKDWAIAQRRGGRTQVTVSELYAVMLDAIDQTPGLAQRMKNALAWRLQLELFRDLGLRPGDTVELPYPNVKAAP